LEETLKQANGKRVCGIFNAGQVSSRFLRRVVAASLATTLTAAAHAQADVHTVSTPINFAYNYTTELNKSDYALQGFVVSESMELNSKEFQGTLAAVLNQKPEGKQLVGTVYISVALNVVGRLSDLKIVRSSLDATADREALRALESLADMRFTLPQENGQRVQQVVVPVTFGPIASQDK
jgi:TonB family protein